MSSVKNKPFVPFILNGLVWRWDFVENEVPAFNTFVTFPDAMYPVIFRRKVVYHSYGTSIVGVFEIIYECEDPNLFFDDDDVLVRRKK